MSQRYNPAVVHQVLSEMAWQRMREYTHQMSGDQLLATHLFVMSEILTNQDDHRELWRRVRERNPVFMQCDHKKFLGQLADLLSVDMNQPHNEWMVDIEDRVLDLLDALRYKTP